MPPNWCVLAASRPRVSILLRFRPRQSAADFPGLRHPLRPALAHCGRVYEHWAQLSYHLPQRFPQLPSIQLHRHLTTPGFLLNASGEPHPSTAKLYHCSVSVGRCRGKTRDRSLTPATLFPAFSFQATDSLTLRLLCIRYYSVVGACFFVGVPLSASNRRAFGADPSLTSIRILGADCAFAHRIRPITTL